MQSDKILGVEEGELRKFSPNEMVQLICFFISIPLMFGHPFIRLPLRFQTIPPAIVYLLYQIIHKKERVRPVLMNVS